MTVSSEEELRALQEIGRIVGQARDEMLKAARPGITTGELDAIGEAILLQYGARSAPQLEYGFPGVTCISVDDEVAHGIPGEKILQDGDLINIDVSAELNGYFADTGASVVVGGNDREKTELCDCSKRALNKAISGAKSGTKMNRIGRAMYNEARDGGYTVIKNLSGHGIGRRLHEEPHNILVYEDKSDRLLLKTGMVLAVESFVSTGAEYVVEDAGGWVLRTPDKSLVAQYEHTIVVTEKEPLILT